MVHDLIMPQPLERALICLNGVEEDRRVSNDAVCAAALAGAELAAGRRGRQLSVLPGARLCRVRFRRTKGRIDLRSDPPRCQGGETRLRSAGLDLVGEFVPPFPDVRFRRCHDRKLNASVDHGSPLYHLSGKQLLFGLQSIRANTGVDQLPAAGQQPHKLSSFPSVPVYDRTFAGLEQR
jgi:hypothetical protein